MKWYVLHVERGKESIAYQSLKNKGYDVYCPVVYRDRRFLTTSARVKNIKDKEALFPSYLFILMNDDGDWEGIQVRNERGFEEYSQVLRGGDKYPISIPDSDIETLKSREDENGVHVVENWRHQKGDRVRIKSGAFKDVQGIIKAVTDRNILVLIDAMGRKNKIKLKENQIEPA